MKWKVCYWGGLEWFAIAAFDSIDNAMAVRDDCIRRSGRRLHWKVIGEK